MEPSIRATDHQRWVPGVVFAALFLGAAPAHAQAPGGDAALAEALFQQGKQAMDEGKYGDACPKLAESQRLDPAGGTLLRLALCHEKEGRTASSWAEYSEALAQGRRENRPDRVAMAEEGMARVTPLLSKLAVAVAPEAQVQGLEIRRDDVVLGKPVWNLPVPIDPGKHRVEARATGRKPWLSTIDVGPGGDAQTVRVPVLEAEAVAPPPVPVVPVSTTPPIAEKPAQNPIEPEPKRSSRTLGIVLASTGAVSLIAGGFFGMQALSNRSQANRLCPTSPCNDQHGADLAKQSTTSAWIADFGVGIGVVAIGVGGYLVLSSPSSASKKRASHGSLSMVPGATANSASLRMEGTW